MSRSGKTLLEILIVITISSMLLVMCTHTMTSVFRAGGAQSESVHRSSAFLRLADQFRNDVHAATRAVLNKSDEKRTELVLTEPEGERVVYEVGGRTTRTASREDRRVSFEEWPLGRDRLRIELSEDGRTAVLILVNDAHEVRADARVGFDQRFARREKP